MPIDTLSRLLTSRRPWIQGTAAVLLLGSAAKLVGQECAPPPDSFARKRPALAAPLGCAPCKKLRREPSREELEAQAFSEELSAAISAAVAEAVAQQQAQGAAAGPGAAAPAQFQAPAPSGQIAGASHSIGLRGFEIHFPELRLALPTLQLPSLVKFRREPHMRLDPAEAPLIAPASAAPAGYSPQAYSGGPYGYGSPYGYAPAAAAPASAAPASAQSTAPTAATGAPAGAGCRPKTRVRRVGPAKQRFWSNEEEWEVIQEVPADDCAPEYEADRGTTSRAAGHTPARHPAGRALDAIPKAPAADAGGVPGEAYDLPPEPGVTHSQRPESDDLQSARAELAAARRQLAEVTKILAAAGVEVPTASPPTGPADGATSGRTTSPPTTGTSRSTATPPRTTALRTAAEQTASRRGTQAATVQRLFQELEAVDDHHAVEPDAVAEEGAEDPTEVPATTHSRRSPGPVKTAPVQPAGHVSPSPVRRPATKASQSPVKTAPAATSLRGGKGAVGPGHALGR